MLWNKLFLKNLAMSLIVVGCSAPVKPLITDPPAPPPNYGGSKPPAHNPTTISPPPLTTEKGIANAESPVYSRKQIIEQRGPGGVVNKITVDQSGNVPDYVIYPQQAPTADTNNNPNKIAPPNWQFSW